MTDPTKKNPPRNYAAGGQEIYMQPPSLNTAQPNKIAPSQQINGGARNQFANIKAEPLSEEQK